MPEFKLKQLEQVLNNYDMFIVTIYKIDGDCVYIKIRSQLNMEDFLLYISSKYTIPCKSINTSIYEINYIELTESEETPEDFAINKNDFDIEEEYSNFDSNYENMDLQEFIRSYNKKIEVKDYSKINEFKTIIRQLKRLRFCVSDSDIKLGIVSKLFLCCIKYDNSFDCYDICEHNQKSKKLHICIDIDSFLKGDRIKTFASTIKKTKFAVYDLLTLNQNHNKKKFEKLSIDFNAKSKNIPDKCLNLREKYDLLCENRIKIISTINSIEKGIIDKTKFYEGKNTLNSDIDKTRVLHDLENKLAKAKLMKDNIESKIIEFQELYENNIMDIDKTYFENIVMLSSIIKNLNIE